MPIYTIQEIPKARGFPPGEVLGTQKRKSEDRFHIGEKIVLPRVKPNQELKIVSSNPTANPAGVDVTYYVEYMSDLEKQAGGSIVGFPSYYVSRAVQKSW